MKHLLEHAKMQVLQELDTLKGPHVNDPKLEYAYEDLLDSIDRVLEESGGYGAMYKRDQPSGFKPQAEVGGGLQGDNPMSPPKPDIPGNQLQFGVDNKERTQNLAGNDARKSSRPPNTPQASLDSLFEKSGSGEFDHEHFSRPGDFSTHWQDMQSQAQEETDRHHAKQDGSKESFEEMKQNVEKVTATDLNPDRLRELADIAEKVEEENVDPRDMSDDEFGKLLSRLRPNLVDWATGKKGNMFWSDQGDIVEEIRKSLQVAQEESDGNIDLLRTFQENVKDSLFDMSRHRDNDYEPEYDDLSRSGLDDQDTLGDEDFSEEGREVADQTVVNDSAGENYYMVTLYENGEIETQDLDSSVQEEYTQG